VPVERADYTSTLAAAAAAAVVELVGYTSTPG